MAASALTTPANPNTRATAPGLSPETNPREEAFGGIRGRYLDAFPTQLMPNTDIDVVELAKSDTYIPPYLNGLRMTFLDNCAKGAATLVRIRHYLRDVDQPGWKPSYAKETTTPEEHEAYRTKKLHDLNATLAAARLEASLDRFARDLNEFLDVNVASPMRPVYKAWFDRAVFAGHAAFDEAMFSATKALISEAAKRADQEATARKKTEEQQQRLQRQAQAAEHDTAAREAAFSRMNVLDFIRDEVKRALTSAPSTSAATPGTKAKPKPTTKASVKPTANAASSGPTYAKAATHGTAVPLDRAGTGAGGGKKHERQPRGDSHPATASVKDTLAQPPPTDPRQTGQGKGNGQGSRQTAPTREPHKHTQAQAEAERDRR